MEKQPEKTLIEPITKEEGEVDGDNLLLSPEKLKKKLPDFDFKKMVGREEEDDQELREGNILILNPQKPEKKLPDIDFQKMIGRPEGKEKDPDQEAEEGDRVILNPKYPETHLQVIDFAKQTNRPEIKNAVEDGDSDEVVLNPTLPQKIKGFVEMERMSSVRLVPYLRKKHETNDNEW